jgi:hypothetical protein
VKRTPGRLLHKIEDTTETFSDGEDHAEERSGGLSVPEQDSTPETDLAAEDDVEVAFL